MGNGWCREGTTWWIDGIHEPAATEAKEEAVAPQATLEDLQTSAKAILGEMATLQAAAAVLGDQIAVEQKRRRATGEEPVRLFTPRQRFDLDSFYDAFRYMMRVAYVDPGTSSQARQAEES